MTLREVSSQIMLRPETRMRKMKTLTYFQYSTPWTSLEDLMENSSLNFVTLRWRAALGVTVTSGIKPLTHLLTQLSLDLLRSRLNFQAKLISSQDSEATLMILIKLQL